MNKLAVVLVAIVLSTLAGRTAAAQTFLTADEATSFALVNGQRAKEGQTALTRQTDLNRMARGQAVRMAQRGSIYHNPNLAAEANAAGLNWRRLGENVGVGPDVQSIHQAFLASPHHHENMVYPTYNNMGVGVVPGTDGRVFVVHVFADLAPRPSARPTLAPTRAPIRTLPVAVRPVSKPGPAPRRVEVTNALVGGVVDLRTVFGPARSS